MSSLTAVPANIKKPSKAQAINNALKELYSKTSRDNFMLIEFDYSKHLLLPYDEALTFLGCLKQAELYTERYNEPKRIGALPTDTFKTRILSRKEYEDIKIAAMLGVTVDELNQAEENLPF